MTATQADVIASHRWEFNRTDTGEPCYKARTSVLVRCPLISLASMRVQGVAVLVDEVPGRGTGRRGALTVPVQARTRKQSDGRICSVLVPTPYRAAHAAIASTP